MHFRDPVAWAAQELEFQADETSRQFLAFFLDWFGCADGYLSSWTLNEHCTSLKVADAVRNALIQTEKRQKVSLSMEWIGQMMLVASDHWKYGEELVEQLTVIERRAVQIMFDIKLATLQESATL
jgi:hypothetical protein